MKKRKVMTKTFALCLSAVLIGGNAASAVAAVTDTGFVEQTSGTAQTSQETKEDVNVKATTKIDLTKGYFEGYGQETGVLSAEHLEESNYCLGWLPTVIAKDGYKWTGWKVTDSNGAVVYTLDAGASSIMFANNPDLDYTVEATFEKEVVEEVNVTAVTKIDLTKGYFEGYGQETGALSAEHLEESNYCLGWLPTVVAKDGYKWTGWKVTNSAGEVVYTLGTETSSIMFEKIDDDYTVEATFEKEVVEEVNVKATTKIDLTKGYFPEYEGTAELFAEHLEESNYALNYLPKVTAKDGYTWTGWKVTNSKGEVVYTLDTNTTSIMFAKVNDSYTVEATFDKKAERTVNVYFNVDAEKGYFTDPEGAEVVSYENLPENIADQFLDRKSVV